MKEPVWLTLRDVLALHEMQLEAHGGATGVRDLGMLESALSRAQNRYAYEPGCDVFDLATSYVHGIARNHPFVDGNKRASFLAGYVFLASNGWTIDASEEDVVRTMLALAAGDLSEDEFANWLRKSCKPRA